MYIDVSTGNTYETRKDAKLQLGHYTFNRKLKNKEIFWLSDEKN